jgi:hypothetical protein
MENLEDYSPSTAPNSTKVFVNGVWLGIRRDPVHLVSTPATCEGRSWHSLPFLSLYILFFFVGGPNFE